MSVMTEAAVQPPSEFVQFWNEILVPKFIKYKHVLVGGLTKHSDAIFPKLEVNEGERVMDAGAGFGDTAIMLAKRVGPTGHVMAIDCATPFSTTAAKTPPPRGSPMSTSLKPISRSILLSRIAISCSRALARCFSKAPWRPCATCGARSSLAAASR
jgi:hypothetical protein